MFELITKGISKIFGTKSDRDIKEVLPHIELTKAEFLKLANVSDNELRQLSQSLKLEIKEGLRPIEDQLASLHSQIENQPNMSLGEKDTIFNSIDKLEKDRDVELEVILLKLLPRAFAIMRDTARRLKENKQLVVDATDFDKQVASRRKGVTIEGTKAIWSNKWLAAGSEMTWEMMHYEVQLIGGFVLHQGKVSEMATGEGKTLVATLPAFLNALSGFGVHVVTVNDYLAKRDSEWMGPLFEFHLLTIDCIDKHEPNSDERKNAYLADITYGTNNEFGFDYLRDNMAKDISELVQRKPHYAMVDEVDSVLIDDARTPLIISGPVPRGDEHEFHQLKPRVVRLVEEQKKLTNQYLNEAKKKIEEGDKTEGGLALLRAHRSLPKSKPLIKFLSETGNKLLLQKTENFYMQDNSKEMPKVDLPMFFTIDERNNSIDLTEKGIDLITQQGEDPHLFILPDIGTELAKIENNKSLSEHESLHLKEALITDYNIKSERVHTIHQLLKAYTLFEKEVDYIIDEGKVKIVDEQTGRMMEGRRYSDGLHQALEAKENVKVENASQTYATITLQNYFRMYHKLCGMTGTAETEAGELWEIYKLDVVTIPTNLIAVRKDMEDKVYKTVREKFNAVVDEVNEMNKLGRPVLVGTTSVEMSELLSRMLKMRQITHKVLNAKYHQQEAQIIADAGKPGAVTIATNMAGRGTDIKLSPESKAAGGLAIIGTERHESRRVDRQLRGRAGRQGDPGSSQFFVSLEDSLMRLFGSEKIAKFMDRLGLEEGEVIQHSMITKSIERAQKKVEENNFGVRKRLLEYDDVMNSQREVIYKRRKNALYGERLPFDIQNMLYDVCDQIANGFAIDKNESDFKLEVISKLGLATTITSADINTSKPNALSNKLYAEAWANYSNKKAELAAIAEPVFKDIKANRPEFANIVVPIHDGRRKLDLVVEVNKFIETSGSELSLTLGKFTSLLLIDTEWREHLREMDELKQSVQNAVYEQKDPLLIYKMEAYKLFRQFINKVDNDIIAFLTKAEIYNQQPNEIQTVRTNVPQLRNRQTGGVKESKETARNVTATPIASAEDEAPVEKEKQIPITSQKIAGRNDKVSVQYLDGTIKQDVKFKSIEEDLKNNKCIILA